METNKAIPWNKLFAPASVAVIGASNTPGSWGFNTMKGLLATGGRHIYPVNPNAAEIHGIKAFRSVTDIPGPVDLAVIVVAERFVSIDFTAVCSFLLLPDDFYGFFLRYSAARCKRIGLAKKVRRIAPNPKPMSL